MPVFRRPLIALGCRPRNAGEVAGWRETDAAVMQATYIDSLWRAGGTEAMLFPRALGEHEAEAYLSRVDGLILVGGGDVEPFRYGQEPHPKAYGLSRVSDDFELVLARAAFRMGIPFFAICRGVQILNVALGGTLHQHLPDVSHTVSHGATPEGDAGTHAVDVEPKSLLSRSVGRLSRLDACFSAHHQAIDRLAPGLVVSGRTADGVVEAVERDRPADGWLLGVQWHPERTTHVDHQQQSLFDALVTAAGEHMLAQR